MPEAKTLQKVIFSDQNAKLQRSLIGLAHGPMLPTFENSPGLTSLGALAMQGKRAFTLFLENPNGRHGRAFVSPLSFWTGAEPLGHDWVPENLLEDQRFVIFHRPPVPHVKSLSESIRTGDRHTWVNSKWQKRNVYADYYDNQVQNARTR